MQARGCKRLIFEPPVQRCTSGARRCTESRGGEIKNLCAAVSPPGAVAVLVVAGLVATAFTWESSGARGDAANRDLCCILDRIAQPPGTSTARSIDPGTSEHAPGAIAGHGLRRATGVPTRAGSGCRPERSQDSNRARAQDRPARFVHPANGLLPERQTTPGRTRADYPATAGLISSESFLGGAKGRCPELRIRTRRPSAEIKGTGIYFEEKQ